MPSLWFEKLKYIFRIMAARNLLIGILLATALLSRQIHLLLNQSHSFDWHSGETESSLHDFLVR